MFGNLFKFGTKKVVSENGAIDVSINFRRVLPGKIVVIEKEIDNMMLSLSGTLQKLEQSELAYETMRISNKKILSTNGMLDAKVKGLSESALMAENEMRKKINSDLHHVNEDLREALKVMSEDLAAKTKDVGLLFDECRENLTLLAKRSEEVIHYQSIHALNEKTIAAQKHLIGTLS